MEIIERWFGNNPWLNVLFLVLTIFSIILAYYFYYKANREKRPVFISQSIPLLIANPIVAKNLEIKYNNKLITSLQLTKIAIWNDGKETIRKVDIAPKAPFLIISPKESDIYDFEIVYQNRNNNLIIEKIDDHTLKIEFDFLDYLDGFTLNIFHNSVKGKAILIQASFIGAKRLASADQEEKVNKRIDWIFTPINYLINKKNKSLRILGYVILFPIFFISLPLLLAHIPIGYFANKKDRNNRKKFMKGE